MIKINLLPQEERRRRAPTSPLLLLPPLGAILLLGGMFYGWWWLSGQLGGLQDDIQRTQVELKRFEELAKQVDQYKNEKKVLEEKIKVIQQLTAAQSGPVRLLDEVSRALPNEVWLTAMSRTGKKLDIGGVAFSNFSLATFMTNLSKASTYFASVDLVASERTVIEKVPVERFNITMEVKDSKG
jgi:type IV pilus assembly protein PilN